MSERNLYRILGVSNHATNEEIRQAFLKLSKKYHPDVNTHDPLAHERFKEIAQAYETLSDSRKRAEYESSAALNPDYTYEFDQGAFMFQVMREMYRRYPNGYPTKKS